MSALLDLALRCEAATGSDRKLKLAIYAELGWTVEKDELGFDCWIDPDGNQRGNEWEKPDFTASLDAAMTLVPDELEWSVRYCELPDKTRAAIARIGKFDCGLNTSAATPALALCAAALRARATAGDA